MLDKIKDFIKRIRVRLSALLAALLLSLPYALDALGYIDLKPLLIGVFGESVGSTINSLLPFLLAFFKAAVHLEPQDAD